VTGLLSRLFSIHDVVYRLNRRDDTPRKRINITQVLVVYLKLGIPRVSDDELMAGIKDHYGP